jgi:hypothetical protein
MADLQRLVGDFFSNYHHPNPPLDAPALFNDFLNQIQEQGKDLSEWDESDWRGVMSEFGLETEGAVLDALENLAGWGVVDNYTWETTTEQEIEEEIEG